MEQPTKAGSHWDKDRLARKEDAEFLSNYLVAYSERAKGFGRGVSVNVNAPWGAGKSFFLAGMAETLNTHGHRVARVDAWRNDHADDPLFVVVAEVLSALGKTRKNSALRARLTASAGKIAVTAGKGILQKGVSVLIGSTATDEISKAITDAATEAVNETISDYAASALERFEDGKKAIEDFRQAIANELQEGPPLIVLVDELDRCRPTYAVLMLERIKHLFDVPNLVFVIATNTEQLAHTIRAVYGTGFDADHYLKRFFDRSFTFDEPSFEALIADRWEAAGLDKIGWLAFEHQPHVESLAKIASLMRLEPRDIEQCLEVLWGVVHSMNREVPVPLLYLFPLVALHHLAKANEVSSLFKHNGAPSTVAKKMLPEDAFFSKSVRHYEGEKVYEANIIAVFSAFSKIIEKGLQEHVRDESPATHYAQRYQSAEFAKLHNNSHRGLPVRSLLADYPRLIRLAGRTS